MNKLTTEQSHFVEWARASERAPITIVDSPPGSGKTVALLALADSVARSTDAARVLIACPAVSLLSQFQVMLHELNPEPPYYVHLYSSQAYLERPLAATADLAAPGITLATFSLIRRLLNRANDLALTWDLIVSDGNLSSKSLLADFFFRSVRTGRVRRLVLTGAPYVSALDRQEAEPLIERVAIQSPNLIRRPMQLFKPIEFTRTEAEERVFAAIQDVAAPGTATRSLLDGALASSVAAAEQILLQMRNEVAHEGELSALTYDGPTGDPDEGPPPRKAEESAPLNGARVLNALRELYGLDEDSKFEAFREFVRSHGSDSVAFAANFKATEEYIRSILEQDEHMVSVIVVTESTDIRSLPRNSLFVIYDMDAPGIAALSRAEHHELPKEIAIMTPLGVSMLPTPTFGE